MLARNTSYERSWDANHERRMGTMHTDASSWCEIAGTQRETSCHVKLPLFLGFLAPSLCPRCAIRGPCEGVSAACCRDGCVRQTLLKVVGNQITAAGAACSTRCLSMGCPTGLP